MYLTRQEEKMYDGEFGVPVQKAMKILVALGDVYEAEKMVRIRSAHVAGLSYKSHGDAGLKFAEDMVKAGARVRAFTTTNPLGVDREGMWEALGLPRDFATRQLRIGKAYEQIDCACSFSCVPYLCGNLPRFGEHISWAESSAVVFTNSVIGARDNREGGLSALAAALTGRTPAYDLHLDENRLGEILIDVHATLKGIQDFGALGAYVGQLVGDKIPVFKGIPRNAPLEYLIEFGAAQAATGSVRMYHIIGLTPEAPNIETAFGEETIKDKIEINSTELKRAHEMLTTATDQKVELVVIGCPHCSLRQTREIAKLLSGKKVHKEVLLFVHTSKTTKTFAEQMGYTQMIEGAGGHVTTDMCTILGPFEALGFKRVGTNSAKLATHTPSFNRFKAFFGSTRKCIEAAIRGTWIIS